MGSMCWVGNVGIHATGHLGLKMEPMYGIHIWTSDVKNPCVDLREPTTPCHSDLKFQQRIGSIHLTGVCGIRAWTGGALHARSLGPKSHPCKPSIRDQDVWSPYVTKEPSPRMRHAHVYPTLQPLGVTVVNVQDPYIGLGTYGIHMRPERTRLRKTRLSPGAWDSVMATVGVARCMDRSPYGLCCHRCCHGYRAAQWILGKAGGATTLCTDAQGPRPLTLGHLHINELFMSIV